MDYTLDSYGDFDLEQQILATASKKKVDLEKQNESRENEITFRFRIIKGYFLRLSWIHKKDFILSILKRMTCFNTLLKMVNYISTLHGKMAAYTDVSPHIRCTSQQILMDHDRTTEKNCLKETACEDINWIAELNNNLQMDIVMDLLTLGGGGLMRKLYIPLVTIYNRKIFEDTQRKQETGNFDGKMKLEEIFCDKYLDDTDKYPQDHPLSIEVEKMRKKWDEMMDKARREVFGSSREDDIEKAMQKKADSDKKSKSENKNVAEKAGKSGKGSSNKGVKSSDTVDWVQVLPIWIVKNILNYLDQKTLLSLKKVNNYWSHVSDSIIKERQARKFLDQSIEKMRSNVDPDVLREYDEDEIFLEDFFTPAKQPNCPREIRMKKLMNRGAILPKMVPKVKTSQQVQFNLLTSLPRDKNICMPLEKTMVFPRLVRDDLLLYKSFPCALKDVNILIDVQDDIEKQRYTLSYSLSQQLSDAFSMSEANLADW